MARALEELSVPLPGGVGTLEALAAGPEDGELVLLLHGFPQDASAYAEVLPLLADAGLRAVALTQRGYAPGHRPRDPAAYALPRLAEDALGAAEALGSARPHVVGHDWGAVVGWHLAGHRPERIRTLTAVSVPHPRAFAAAMVRSLQPLRSSYIAFFRVPAVSARVLAARDGHLLRSMLRSTGLPTRHVDAYTARLVDDGALRAALAWYRNAWPRAAQVPWSRVPTTFVWGDRDVTLDRAGAERTGGYVEGDYRFAVVEGGSHWIPERHPRRLADLVLERVRGC